MAKYLEDGRSQLHVRAITDSKAPGEIYLSAHVEARRDRWLHWLGGADNERGRQLLWEILHRTGLTRYAK